MDFVEYLRKYDAQKKIDKLARLYKNKRIAIYGAGQFSSAVFDNYDLSKLNIVAVADIKFEKEENCDFHGYNCIEPNKLADLDCDIILIANFNYNFFIKILDSNILYRKKNASIEIRPLIRLNFADLFLKGK